METTQQFIAHYTRELFTGPRGLIAAISDLSVEELNARPHPNMNSLGFEAWHVFRTADNIMHFVFHREPPVWAQQALADAWGLPRNAQGTSMEPDEVHGWQFPDAEVLAQYGRDVAEAVVPRIGALDAAFLDEVTRVNPHGEITRLQALAVTILAHGNTHLGQLNIGRTLLDKPSLDF